MPRLNNVMKRVFADMSAKSVEDFLRIEEDLGLQTTPSQAAWKKRYQDLAEEFIGDLEDLAIIENILIQLRCKLMIESELRLSLSRNYIYARSTFFRRGKEINDIRVVVGKTEDWGNNIDELINDLDFRQVCTLELEKAMDMEIEKNIINLNKVYANG
jgi:hypothetical protein